MYCTSALSLPVEIDCFPRSTRDLGAVRVQYEVMSKMLAALRVSVRVLIVKIRLSLLPPLRQVQYGHPRAIQLGQDVKLVMC